MAGESATNSRYQPELTTSVLREKLRIPTPFPNHLIRPQLLERLLKTESYTFALLCAPAGYGKTSLVADAAHRQGHVVWLSLTPEDNEISRFWRIVIAAVRSVRHDLDDLTEGILNEVKIPTPENLLSTLLDALSALDDTTLVFDGFDTIRISTIHEGIAFLIDHLPPHIRVWMTTRSEPSLGLARLRANGQLLELRQENLSFSDAEIREFIGQQVKHDLSEVDIQYISARTEGWPAGLRLAALHLNTSSIEGIQALNGSHADFIDYFQEEVIRHQPERIRQFLLRSSILDTLDVSSATAVIDMQEAPELLAWVEREQCFIHVVNSQHTQFRYHPLFREALKALLNREYPQSVIPLHHRATRWHAKRRDFVNAIHHALEAEQFQPAIVWILKISRALLLEGETTLLRRWFNQLPLTSLQMNVRLRLIEIWTRLLEGHWELLERDLDEIESKIETQGSERERETLLGEIMTIRAAVARSRLEIPAAMVFIRRALNLLQEEVVLLRGTAEFLLASLLYMSQDWMSAQQLFEAEPMPGNEGAIIQVIRLVSLAYIKTQLGALQEAMQLYLHARAFIENSVRQPLRVIGGLIDTGIGEIELEWNHLESAELHLSKGLRLAFPLRHFTGQLMGYFLLARVRMLLGNVHGANTAIQQMEEAIYSAPYRFPQTYLRGLAAQFELYNGNRRTSEKWLRTNGLSFQREPIPIRAAEYFTMAQILLTLNQPEGIAEFFSAVIPLAYTGGYIRITIEMLALTALAYSAQENNEAAIKTILEALQLAEPQDYRRLFLDKGEPMRRLLFQVGANSTHGTYIAALLEDFEHDAPIPGATGQPLLRSILAEPLTERELDVLRLMASGQSNEGIAASLMISVGTVKTHVKSILRKLNTKNRTEASARGRKLGLIDD